MSPSDYQRVVDDIAAKIEAGTLRKGDRLPSIVQLAAEYETSRTTVKTALLILGQRKLTEGHQGKATFVIGEPTAAS